MFKKFIFISVLIFASVAYTQAKSSGFGSMFGNNRGSRENMSPLQKQEAKEKSRWTMADWLDTKKVIANQNMWLAGNKAKPVEHEFYISYDQTNLEKEVISAGIPTLTKPSFTRTAFGAFTSFVGLSGEYLDHSDHMYGWNAQFNLRLFGNSIQNTNFTLIYGGRTRIDNSTATTETFKNQYYGATFALYLSKKFGIEGVYREIMNEKSDQNNFLKGSNVEGSIFIDYSIIRVVGTWFKESLELTDPSQVVTNKNSTGILAGAKFYF
ncbi:MAG: hypothetical protein A4S09_01870 [Proteobacteria bacterium SG_bin7]|nr:MAG: hypothetical protein A4S09_01870 [Proteobacteria bacterium SG_bin7]